jgi:hypothetical protein
MSSRCSRAYAVASAILAVHSAISVGARSRRRAARRNASMQMIAAHAIQYHHVERRRGRPLLIEAAYMKALRVRMPMHNLMDRALVVLLSDMVDNSDLPTRPNSRVFSHDFGIRSSLPWLSCGRFHPSRLCTGCPSPLLRPHPAPIGSEGSGIASTSRAVQRRLANPAAIAGVR